MKTSPCGPGGPFTSFGQECWFKAAKPIAAGTAIIPCYWAWIQKSALQLGNEIPKQTLKSALTRGVIEGAPSVAIIVGSQTLMQDKVEKYLAHYMEPDTTKFTVTSSLIVGASTSWALAGYNGKTAGKGFWKSVLRLKPLQIKAVSVRETGFLFSIRGSAPLEAKLNQKFGENWFNAYIAAFTGGGLGSIIVHPADSAFTMLQHDVPIITTTRADPLTHRIFECGKVLMRGWKPKSLGTAIFATTYLIAKKSFGIE